MIELKGICKSYSSKNILNGVDLYVNRGDFAVIVGKSGCGKSTLLKILGSFEKADSGTLLIDGKTPSSPSIDRIMVFQDFSQLFPWKSVIENVITPLKKKHPKLSRNTLLCRAHEMLRLVGLDEYSNYYPHQLSGGMKQRAAIARAVISSPDILLMDEPFASLDAISRENLQNLTLSLWERYRTTIVFVTHDISEAVMLSTKVAVLRPNGLLKCIQNPLVPGEKNPDIESFILFKKEIAGLL